jgi:hypothetical protein
MWPSLLKIQYTELNGFQEEAVCIYFSVFYDKLSPVVAVILILLVLVLNFHFHSIRKKKKQCLVFEVF